MIEPIGEERLDMAVAQLSQLVFSAMGATPPDLERLTGRNAVLVSRQERKAARRVSRVRRDPKAAERAKVVRGFQAFRAAHPGRFVEADTNGDDRKPGP